MLLTHSVRVRVAVVVMVAVVGSPLAPLVEAQAPTRQARLPPGWRQAPAAQAPDGAGRALHDCQRCRSGHVSAADRQLGQPEAAHGVRRDVLYPQGR